jgi:hypothetical protein
MAIDEGALQRVLRLHQAQHALTTSLIVWLARNLGAAEKLEIAVTEWSELANVEALFSTTPEDGRIAMEQAAAQFLEALRSPGSARP